MDICAFFYILINLLGMKASPIEIISYVNVLDKKSRKRASKC